MIKNYFSNVFSTISDCFSINGRRMCISNSVRLARGIWGYAPSGSSHSYNHKLKYYNIPGGDAIILDTARKQTKN